MMAAAAAMVLTACEKATPVTSEGNVINFTTELTPVQVTENGEPATRVLSSDHEGIVVYVTQGNISDMAPDTRSMVFHPTVADIDKFDVACHNGSSYEFNDGVYNLKTKSWVGTAHHFHGDPTKPLKFYTYSVLQGDPATAPAMNTSSAVPSISYAMPVEVDDQHDLVAACSVASDSSTESVELTFKHILSAICIRDELDSPGFVVPGLGYEIKYINVLGLYSQGSFALSNENLNPPSSNGGKVERTPIYWNNLANKRDFVMPSYTDNDGNTTFSTPEDELGYMIVPQNASGAYLKIGFVKKGENLLKEATYELSEFGGFKAGMCLIIAIRINQTHTIQK